MTTQPTYGRHVDMARRLRPLRDQMEVSRGVRLAAASDDADDMAEWDAAALEVAQVAASELDEARRWLAHNVNGHCRQLGLPTDRDIDMENFARGVQVAASTVRTILSQVVVAMKPLAALFESIQSPGKRDDYVVVP